MSTHNIGFYEDLTKIIFELSSNIIKYAPYFFCCTVDQGPVVQSIVSLKMLLRSQFVKYMPTTLSNSCYFLLEKFENFLHCKDSHIFSTKNHILFVIFMFEIFIPPAFMPTGI